MTAKQTARAGTGGFRRSFVDRNRNAKITDRRFHAAWEELRASRLWITETVVGGGTRRRPRDTSGASELEEGDKSR